MTQNKASFGFVESQLRKKNFGTLGTIGGDGRPHSTGVLYRIPPPPHPLLFYIITGGRYQKTKNMMANPAVSFVVPFPHYYLRFVPSNCIQFQGTAEILPVTDPLGVETFRQSRMLRMSLQLASGPESVVFIRITPDSRLYCYGVGMSIMRLKNDHAAGSYVVEAPNRETLNTLVPRQKIRKKNERGVKSLYSFSYLKLSLTRTR